MLNGIQMLLFIREPFMGKFEKNHIENNIIKY